MLGQHLTDLMLNNKDMIIQDGTFIASDQFLAELAFNDIQVSKVIPIELPKWQAGEFHIDPSALSLASGVTDPNVLFHSAITSYWHTLTRAIRRHAQNVGAQDSQDYSEQAFFKLLMKLGMSQTDIIAMLKTENYNGTVIAKTIGGITAKQLTLRIDAMDQKREFQILNRKPGWLQIDSIDVPESNFADTGTTYFISSNQSLSAEASRVIADDFRFNALLVYFNDKLGGIYFLHRFAETDTGIWESRSRTKTFGDSFAFNINLFSQGAQLLDYNAEQQNTAEAFQKYMELFTENIMLKERISNLHESIVTLSEQISAISDLLSVTGVAELMSLAQVLQNNPANNQAEALLRAFEVAESETLREDFEVPTSIGNYASGDTISAGTSIHTILANIFI